MRVTDLYLRGIGPFGRGKELFALHTDDSRVLLTGISGSGKSTALWAMGFLWRLLGDKPACGEGDRSPEGEMAMRLAGLSQGDILIVWGSPDFAAEAAAKHPQAQLLRAGQDAPDALRGRIQPPAPNMILLDADYHLACGQEPLEDAWFLTDDDVKDVWPEALSRLNKAGHPGVAAAISGANRLLFGKRLDFGPKGEVRVVLTGDASHGPGLLSMGERHLAVLCFCAACCLKPGGVLLLDEPAVHLHPSQVMGLLSTLEGYCRKAGAQLLIVSHNPEIWRRYAELGLCVDLEAGHGGA